MKHTHRDFLQRPKHACAAAAARPEFCPSPHQNIPTKTSRATSLRTCHLRAGGSLAPAQMLRHLLAARAETPFPRSPASPVCRLWSPAVAVVGKDSTAPSQRLQWRVRHAVPRIGFSLQWPARGRGLDDLRRPPRWNWKDVGSGCCGLLLTPRGHSGPRHCEGGPSALARGGGLETRRAVGTSTRGADEPPPTSLSLTLSPLQVSLVIGEHNAAPAPSGHCVLCQPSWGTQRRGRSSSANTNVNAPHPHPLGGKERRPMCGGRRASVFGA